MAGARKEGRYFVGMHGRMKKIFTVKFFHVVLLSVCAACLVLSAWLFLRPDRKSMADSGNVTVDNSASWIQGRDSSLDAGLSSRKIYFPGFEDSVFGEHTEVALENPEENGDFYMKYRIVDGDTGTECYESGLIASGKSVSWKPADVLDAGAYHLSIQMLPYYSPDGGATWVPLTSTSNNVLFTILENGSRTAGKSLDRSVEAE